jgi:uncharacterized SAM-binding protein YcdF (DUF218 family)
MEPRAHSLAALVVLGCRVGPHGEVTGALLRRILRAHEAYCHNLAPLILACGGRRWGGRAEAWAMRASLLERGVPPGALLVDLRSLNTHENALQAARLLRGQGQRVGLVTCDWHMPRALTLFRRAGFLPLPLPAPTPPRPLPAQAYRALRERFSGWLDALR